MTDAVPAGFCSLDDDGATARAGWGRDDDSKGCCSTHGVGPGELRCPRRMKTWSGETVGVGEAEKEHLENTARHLDPRLAGDRPTGEPGDRGRDDKARLADQLATIFGVLGQTGGYIHSCTFVANGLANGVPVRVS